MRSHRRGDDERTLTQFRFTVPALAAPMLVLCVAAVLSRRLQARAAAAAPR